jgi:hypothetical protein
MVLQTVLVITVFSSRVSPMHSFNHAYPPRNVHVRHSHDTRRFAQDFVVIPIHLEMHWALSIVCNLKQAALSFARRMHAQHQQRLRRRQWELESRLVETQESPASPPPSAVRTTPHRTGRGAGEME